MPHNHVKVVPGLSEEQKTKLADALAKAMAATIHKKEPNISVTIEEVPGEDWTEKVYKTDIMGQQDILYKKPGYNPLK